nr:MAG TPA: hypothetical protein [Caudoviricetes sp.]
MSRCEQRLTSHNRDRMPLLHLYIDVCVFHCLSFIKKLI